MPDPTVERIVAGFALEARDLVQRATRGVLALEKQGEDPAARGATHDELARCVHTLKGSAETLGLLDVSRIAHRIEDVLGPLRRASSPIPAATADAILRALDACQLRVRAHADGHGEGLPDATELLELLAPGAPRSGSDAPSAPPGPDASTPRDVAPRGAISEDESWPVTMRQVVALTREVERLRELHLRLDERRWELERAALLLGRGAIGAADARVLVRGLARSMAHDGGAAAEIVDSLEDHVKGIATMPLRVVVEPLHRTVRDLCRQLGKQARLSLVGGEVSLDRRTLAALSSPLVHLVRNAIDHGIETPAEREARGKHREGSVVIRAEQRGNLLWVEVEDDGGGLDLERIRAASAAAGLLAEDQVVAPERLAELVFHPGFSTRREVTSVSGRGVGLDVVRTRIEALDGRVEVDSRVGQGTRFALTLPLELGSSPLLVVRCGEHQLGIPLLAVETIRPARAPALQTTPQAVRLLQHDELIPVRDLGALLKLRPPAPPADGQPILVVLAAGRRVALLVDELIGDRELVIRPLPPELRDGLAFQGAATLARGDLLLVLRSDWLVGFEDKPDAVGRARRALVVDDSLTARALYRTMLEAGGFAVHTAGGAGQALDHLRRAPYDVMVCDIAMEGMDGVGLTQTVRETPALRSLPIVLVSARDAEGERARGLSAGADGFLSKRECVAGRLLDEVGEVMRKRSGA